ncbi:MAG: Omp28-related outer membrane protein, partial [Bacteroidia bacterium]
GMGMNRGEWRNAAEMTMGMQAPVNLGAKATFDPATRKLTVKVDIYYTADETVANNLNIAIIQDNLISSQYLPGNVRDREYIQNNVLRDYITGQWGEVITEAKTKGSKITKTYTYDVPADYNGTGTSGGGAVVIEDLKVVAFVSQGRKNILNATEVEVK